MSYTPVSSAEARLAEPPASALTIAKLVYGLHGFAILVGIVGSATVIGSFVGSVPSIVAVILNYLKRRDARGTWLESHYRWQIRTFWLAALWSLVTAIVSGLLLIVLVGIATWVIGLFVLGVWATIRILRGWLKLRDGLTIG